VPEGHRFDDERLAARGALQPTNPPGVLFVVVALLIDVVGP
jgi:hypothetical protein